MRFALLATALLASCTPSKNLNEPDPFTLRLINKSCLVNSATAIEYGEYRVVPHSTDLVHPEWRVEQRGQVVFIGSMEQALDVANQKHNDERR